MTLTRHLLRGLGWGVGVWAFVAAAMVLYFWLPTVVQIGFSHTWACR